MKKMADELNNAKRITLAENVNVNNTVKNCSEILINEIKSLTKDELFKLICDSNYNELIGEDNGESLEDWNGLLIASAIIYNYKLFEYSDNWSATLENEHFRSDVTYELSDYIEENYL
jgi:hypothetical protein